MYLCSQVNSEVCGEEGCRVATQFKVFLWAPDSLNNCRKKYIMTPLSTYQIKDSPKQVQNQELLFQFIH